MRKADNVEKLSTTGLPCSSMRCVNHHCDSGGEPFMLVLYYLNWLPGL